MQARLSDQKPREGKQCLELTVVPKPSETGQPVRPPEALDRTYISVVSPTVRLTPPRTTMFRLNRGVYFIVIDGYHSA